MDVRRRQGDGVGGKDRTRDRHAMTKPCEIVCRRITKIDHMFADVPANYRQTHAHGRASEPSSPAM